ncbi:protein takeout-like isoform X2 [Periplaneta americana]|uniref:protein takeout-like isoform X2 n=1 Tax=Periplaneta americana TaxID=6978 RepID=UPI0037E9BB63
MRLILLAVTLCLAHAEVPKLPSYFKVCSRIDPNFGECVLNSSREIIPHLVKGDKMFNLPLLDPFEIKELKLSHGQGRGQLNLTLRDVKLQGLKDAYILNYSNDFNKSRNSFLLTVPQLKVLGTYNISGQILLLPITGTGNINITLGDEINKLLDENWKEVFDEITPHIAASFLEMFKGIFNGISKQFPADILVPEILS